MQPTFREPVFVRNDDTTNVSASVVEWNDCDGGFSIRIKGGQESVLINGQDWDVIKGCIDAELNRIGALIGEAA